MNTVRIQLVLAFAPLPEIDLLKAAKAEEDGDSDFVWGTMRAYCYSSSDDLTADMDGFLQVRTRGVE
jgi:hypothetical protein